MPLDSRSACDASTSVYSFAELAHRAETVLHRANHAVGVVPLPFERQHRVHDVLQYFRPRQASIFSDVADEDGRYVLALGSEEKLRGRFTHLPNAARRRLEFG